jgi:hypothetical protein
VIGPYPCRWAGWSSTPITVEYATVTFTAAAFPRRVPNG